MRLDQSLDICALVADLVAEAVADFSPPVQVFVAPTFLRCFTDGVSRPDLARRQPIEIDVAADNFRQHEKFNVGHSDSLDEI